MVEADEEVSGNSHPLDLQATDIVVQSEHAQSAGLIKHRTEHFISRSALEKGGRSGPKQAWQRMQECKIAAEFTWFLCCMAGLSKEKIGKLEDSVYWELFMMDCNSYYFNSLFCVQQLNDSSVIISVLESWRQDRQQNLGDLSRCYVCIESEEKGKKVYEYPNKYFIMFMDKTNLPTTPEQRQ